MHPQNRHVNKTPTDLIWYETNKGSSFHSKGREWNKDGKISWTVLSSWCLARSRKYEEDIQMGCLRILNTTATLRQHLIMAGERNETPRGRAEAMELIIRAESRIDGQYFYKGRINEIARNEYLHVTKWEGALRKHKEENKKTMEKRVDRLRGSISEQQSKINSGEAYKSAYALGRDPQNYLAYDPAKYPASKIPFTSTRASLSSKKRPSTSLREQRSRTSSLHSIQNSQQSAPKKRLSRGDRSSHSEEALTGAQSAHEIPDSYSSIKACRRFKSDLRSCRVPRIKGKDSARSYSPSTFETLSSYKAGPDPLSSIRITR